MTIDKLTTLAFSVYSNKGAYAILCGAGISRSAGIKTGWNIEEDLIKKIAATKGITECPDWHKWYKSEYDKEADYSTLLSEVVSTSTERVLLMREYFEPTTEECEEGLKQPTRAHRAIAALAKEGYIRVIISPNFDRLFEQALQEVGIQPQVVYHADDLNKITPLVHGGVTIVKMNGDYLDCRFRNTADELDSYQPEMELFLKRIFEDFGLITCGWSAQWDKGLVEIINDSQRSRYGSYVSYVGKAGIDLEKIAVLRNGELLGIESADIFFTELKEQVFALNAVNTSKALSKDVFVNRVKKYISNGKLMELTELLENEAKNAHARIMEYADYNFVIAQESFHRYLDLHIDIADKLMAAAVEIIRWGEDIHILILKNVLKQLCLFQMRPGSSFYEETKYLHLLASTLLFNVIGVSCVKYQKFGVLSQIFREKTPANSFFSVSQSVNLVYLIGTCHWNRESLNAFLGQRNNFQFSILIFNSIKPYFENKFLTVEEYQQAYCIWEHLYSLLFAYYGCDQFADLRDSYYPTGYFLYQRLYYSRYPDCDYNTFFASAGEQKDNWEPLVQGLFSGKYSEFKNCYERAEEYYKECRRVY